MVICKVRDISSKIFKFAAQKFVIHNIRCCFFYNTLNTTVKINKIRVPSQVTVTALSFVRRQSSAQVAELCVPKPDQILRVIRNYWFAWTINSSDQQSVGDGHLLTHLVPRTRYFALANIYLLRWNWCGNKIYKLLLGCLYERIVSLNFKFISVPYINFSIYFLNNSTVDYCRV